MEPEQTQIDQQMVVEVEVSSLHVQVRACYVTPDFANPVGVSMDLSDRHRLLEIAEAEDLLLHEDNAYGLFHSGGDPTLKALDRRKWVVNLGSFAKTRVPGARVGYAVAGQGVTDGNGGCGLFGDELSKIKSMLTLITERLQAVGKAVGMEEPLAGGVL